MQGIRERLRQWAEYESLHDKLVMWLTDAEAQLKNYSHRSSLEEKMEQLNKFTDSRRIIESKAMNIQEYVTLADQLEQTLVLTLKANFFLLNYLSDILQLVF